MAVEARGRLVNYAIAKIKTEYAETLNRMIAATPELEPGRRSADRISRDP
jgi:hypothetical protein